MNFLRHKRETLKLSYKCSSSVKSKVRDIRKEVIDLKESLMFSQKDINEAKVNIKNIESKVTKVTGDIDETYKDVEDLTIVMNTSKIIVEETTSEFLGFQKRQRSRPRVLGKV